MRIRTPRTITGSVTSSAVIHSLAYHYHNRCDNNRCNDCNDSKYLCCYYRQEELSRFIKARQDWRSRTVGQWPWTENSGGRSSSGQRKHVATMIPDSGKHGEERDRRYHPHECKYLKCEHYQCSMTTSISRPF